MPSTSRSQRRRQPVRTPGSSPQRKPAMSTTRHLEPPDYSRDYDDVRRDLRQIAIIGLVLLAGMIGVSFII